MKRLLSLLGLAPKGGYANPSDKDPMKCNSEIQPAIDLLWKEYHNERFCLQRVERLLKTELTEGIESMQAQWNLHAKRMLGYLAAIDILEASRTRLLKLHEKNQSVLNPPFPVLSDDISTASRTRNSNLVQQKY